MWGTGGTREDKVVTEAEKGKRRESGKTDGEPGIGKPGLDEEQLLNASKPTRPGLQPGRRERKAPRPPSAPRPTWQPGVSCTFKGVMPQIVGWQILSSKNRTQVKAPEVYFKAIPKTVGANKEHAGRSVGDVGDSFLYFSAKITLSELWSMSLLSIKHIFHTTTRLIFIEHKMCKWFHL